MAYVDMSCVQIKNAKLKCVVAYWAYQRAIREQQDNRNSEPSIKKFSLEISNAKKVKEKEQEFHNCCYEYALIEAFSKSSVIKMLGTQEEYDRLVLENEKLEQSGATENMFDLDYWNVEIQK